MGKTDLLKNNMEGVCEGRAELMPGDQLGDHHRDLGRASAPGKESASSLCDLFWPQVLFLVKAELYYFIQRYTKIRDKTYQVSSRVSET